MNGKLRHSNRRRMAKEKERMRWGMNVSVDIPIPKPRRITLKRVLVKLNPDA